MEALELLMLGMQRLEINIGLRRIAISIRTVWVAEGGRHIDILELVGIGPAAARVTGVFQDGRSA
jgi:hypothetical protein